MSSTTIKSPSRHRGLRKMMLTAILLAAAGRAGASGLVDPQQALHDAFQQSAPLAPVLAALEGGARLDEPFHGEGIKPSWQGWHALGRMCDYYDATSLEYLLRATLPYVRDVNARQRIDRDGSIENSPAIAYAASRGLTVVKLLADAGADLSAEWQRKGGVTWNALDVALVHEGTGVSRGRRIEPAEPASDVIRFLHAAGLEPRRHLSDLALLERGVFWNPSEEQILRKQQPENQPRVLARWMQERRDAHAFEMMVLKDDPGLHSEGKAMNDLVLAKLGALRCLTALGPDDYSKEEALNPFQPLALGALRSGDPKMLRLMLDRGFDPYSPVAVGSGKFAPREPWINWLYVPLMPEMIGVIEEHLGMDDRREVWRSLRAVVREKEHLDAVLKLSEGLAEARLLALVQPLWPDWTNREVMKMRQKQLGTAFRQLEPAITTADVEIITAVLQELGALPAS